MTFQAELYPADWRVRRVELIDQAGHRYQDCGIADRAIQENTRTGNPYMVHLSIAHKNQYETWKPDADVMVLCQRCHRRYDRQFRRRAGTRYRSPIGYASVYVDYQERKVLAAMARDLDELRDVVAALPDDSLFELQLVVILAVVGNGFYRKEAGRPVTLAEYGACTGFGQLL